MRKAFLKRLLPKGWLLLATIPMLIVLILALNQESVSASQTPTPEPDAIERLIEDSGGAAEISINSATGVASFIRMPKNAALNLPLGSNPSPTAAANAFFESYGSALGITDAESELKLVDSSVDNTVDVTQLTFQQLYENVPVFAAILKARSTSQSQITSVNGTFVPNIKLKSTIPGLSVFQAEQIAVEAVASQSPVHSSRQRRPTTGKLKGKPDGSSDLTAINSALYVFRTGLVQDVPGSDHLVYEVEVGNASLSIREFVYVDAHSGVIVDQITGIYHDLDRRVSESSLANAIWQEGDDDPIPAGWTGGSAQQVIDWQNEIDGARETYNMFASMADWDSFDSNGATMRTVNNAAISCPNANWNGTSTNYCSNVTGDDTVAHEWGHAYTEYTNNLIYQWQSGALNEAYSDIWGEVVDLLNGRGTDTPNAGRTAGSCSIYGAGTPSVDNSYRWLSGEDDPAFNGAIRDMWDPTCYGDPGKVSDTEYWCTSSDSGGVHTNSGVPNHTFALLVDGGTFNGQTISALGLTKAAHVFWEAQNMLTQASNFADHADALEASCAALIGVDLPALSSSDPTYPVSSGEVISLADCQEVSDAIAAVELRDVPAQCNFDTLLDPNAPALCQGLGTVQSIELENWEGGSLPSGWNVGTHDVTKPSTFSTPNWYVTDSLPTGAKGTFAAFVPDLLVGDCAADDESGALFLDSPVITIPANTVTPRVAFDHWVATEAGWDGGNLKLRVNGGSWTLVPSARFEFNAYNTTLQTSSNTNPLAGQSAYSGSNSGGIAGSWGQSQVNLSGLATAGDTIQLRFDFGVDGCNGNIGWYVDEVEVYACSDELVLACGNGLLDSGESCDDGNAAGGDGCSDTCQIEDGWSCIDPTPPTEAANAISDGSFEAGPGGGAWSESSTNFGTPMCNVATCGTGTGSGPSDGVFWTWFGGIAAYEEGSVSQVVTIPATATDLTFDLEQIICDSGADYMELLVDGNQEYITDGSSSICNTLGYSNQTVDLSAYADDSTHTLAFHSEAFSSNGGSSNFFLDNLVLSDNLGDVGSPSVCSEIEPPDPDVTQDISLDLGPNMISSYVVPPIPALETLLMDIAGKMILIKNGDGQVYWPDQGINYIGDWDVSQGYQIYMKEAATLSITGQQVDPVMPLELSPGWSLIAYLREAPLAVDQALDSINLALYLAKNGDGQVYWPSFGVNQIGDMLPGEGYQVYLNSLGELTYPHN